MKRKRKITACLVMILMIVNIIVLLPVVTNAATTKTASEGAAWALARAEEGWEEDVDNAYNCQCVDLIKAYYQFLGETPVRGNAADYLSLTLPVGWSRVRSSPRAGDIFVQGPGVSGADPKYGHIGIVTGVNGNTVYSVETNYWASKYGNAAARKVTRTVDKFTAFIRPGFADNSSDSDFLPPVAGMSPGKIYRIRNIGTGVLFNYARDSSDKAIFGCEDDGSVEQTFRVEFGNTACCYKLEIMDPEGGFVNFDVPDDTEVNDGIKLTRWDNFTCDITQMVCFREVGENRYVISAPLGTGVIATNGNSTSQRLYTQLYREGDLNQIWELIPVETTPESSPSPAPSNKSDKPIYGIDVSAWQGSIDWNKVSESNVDFAIIRSGCTIKSDVNTYYTDTQFETNYKGATENNINIGLYYFCAAETKESILKVTEDMLEEIDGKTTSYPIFIDVESSEAQKAMGKEALTSCILEALKLIRSKGYEAGVYLNHEWLTKYIDHEVIKANGYYIWYARYPSPNQVVNPADYDFSSYHMWQYTSNGHVDGIDGAVDLDVAYHHFVNPPVEPTITPTAPATDTESILGDLNGDGKVDITDISKLAISLVDRKSLTINEQYRVDLDKDGYVTLADLATLRQYVSKSIETL